MNEITRVDGNSARGSAFVTVGGNGKVNLVDIKVDAGGTGPAYYIPGSVVLQTLKSDGSTDTPYFWVYNKRHGGESGGVAGWYLDMAGTDGKLITRESGIEFDPGTGFWVQGNGKKLVSSGQVLTASSGLPVATRVDGATMIANPYPVTVNLADIKVDAGGTGPAYYIPGSVVLQTLKSDGSTDTPYFWVYNKRHGGESGGVAGWYLDMAGTDGKLITKESGIELEPGDAVWVQGVGKPIVFPAFTLDK